MVTTASPTGPLSNATSELQRIGREVKRIQQQLAQKNSGKRVQEFQKSTRDVRFDNNATARDIGQLKSDETRLNLFSSLGKGDRVDVFRFKVATTKQATFSILDAARADEGKVRFQIFNKATGRLIADSSPKAGEAKANFEALQNGAVELKEGDYILRIARSSDVGPDRDRELAYAVQLTQGLYSKDFDTIEREARSTDDPFGVANVSVATTNLTVSISSSLSFIQKLPRIGSPATAKLAGLLVSVSS